MSAAFSQSIPPPERPAEPLARGRWEAPPWAIGALGTAVFALGVGYFAWRVRRARRGSR